MGGSWVSRAIPSAMVNGVRPRASNARRRPEAGCRRVGGIAQPVEGGAAGPSTSARSSLSLWCMSGATSTVTSALPAMDVDAMKQEPWPVARHRESTFLALLGSGSVVKNRDDDPFILQAIRDSHDAR